MHALKLQFKESQSIFAKQSLNCLPFFDIFILLISYNYFLEVECNHGIQQLHY